MIGYQSVLGVKLALHFPNFCGIGLLAFYLFGFFVGDIDL